MSAAFDDDMINQVATVVSTEARAFNNYATVNASHAGLDFWTPNINPVCLEPRSIILGTNDVIVP